MGSADRDEVAGKPSNTTAALAPDQDESLVQAFHLTVVTGQDRGQTYHSTSDRVVVGADQGVDFQLNDPAVSRFHCEFTIVDGRVCLRDLGSRNGTTVNGVKLMSGELPASATIKIGSTVLKLALADHTVRLQLSAGDRFGALVGRSRGMRTAFAQLERLAASDTTVLIEGETGTGKELAARAIHESSPRRQRPFIVVDCGAVVGQILESELFGHVRGAFTDAVASRPGAFREADGGTVFLDEIGELASELQPKLLRALEQRSVRRVGDDHYTNVDVRVIAATNRELRTEVNQRRFRSDLYYRLAVVVLRLPPLRERPEDLPVLVDELVGKLKTSDPKAAERLRSDEFLADLKRYSWPGNVRELRNYLERCLVLGVNAPLSLPPSAGALDGVVDLRLPYREARDRWSAMCERRYLNGLLNAYDGDVAAAMRAAGVSRGHFYRLLRRQPDQAEDDE